MLSADQFECIDPEVGDLLAAHAQGQLAGGDRQLFVAHLKACVRCAEEERVMREVALGIASLRSRPDPAAAPTIHGAAGPPRRRALVCGAAGVATGVAPLLVVLLAWRPRA